MAERRARTARDARRRTHAQNVLRSPSLAAALARDAGVTRDELVLEIGAGPGLLTEALARRAGRVVAVELDPLLAARLVERFGDVENVFVVQGDALRFPLPAEPFHVVSNVPFNRTTAILRRLLDQPATALRRADLVVQYEVARKRARNRGTLLGVVWAPWFEFSLGRRLPAEAFRPVPTVDAAVLRIVRRRDPLLPEGERDAFVAFVEARFRRPGSAELEPREWIELFRRSSRGS